MRYFAVLLSLLALLGATMTVITLWVAVTQSWVIGICTPVFLVDSGACAWLAKECWDD